MKVGRPRRTWHKLAKLVFVSAFVAEDSWFKTRRWTYCVLDEGHRIKNSETNLAHKVQGVGALYRLSPSRFHVHGKALTYPP